MLRGYRSIFVAFAGLALAGAQQPAKQAQASDSAGQQQATPAQAATPSPTPEPPYRPYAKYNPDPCYQAQPHDAADLCAQWRAALGAEKAAHEARRATTWGIVAALLSLATLIGLIVTILQTQGALGEARRGNRIAQKANARATRQAMESARESRESNRIAAEAQRPWLQIEIEDVTIQALMFDDHIMVNTFPDIVIKNTGSRPAINITRREILVPYTSNTRDEQSQFFDGHIEESGAQVSLITPNGERRLEISGNCELDTEKFQKSGVFCLAISMTYSDGLTGAKRQTAQSFLLGKTLHNAGTFMSDFNSDELINAPPSNPGKLGRTCAVMPLPGGIMT